MLAAALLALVLTVFTWSCQSLSRATAPAATLHLGAEPDINVRVRHGVASATLSGPRLVFITEPGQPGVLLRTPVLATVGPSGVMLSESGGRMLTCAPAAEISSGAPRTPGVEPTVIVDGTAYPGRLRIMPTTRAGDASDGVPASNDASFAEPASIDVVAVMKMETYLPGVVAKELPGGWPDETNRVQAVCARTYAMHQRERARAAGRAYDVESTTRDQAYLGSTDRKEAVNAVRATAGQVLVYSAPGGAQVLRAYYSSTCGGRSASAAEVWPTSRGHEFNRADPIQGRARDWACQGSPVYRWQVQRDRAELERRMRAWGQSAGSGLSRLGTLASVRITRRSATGRPSRYIVADASGREVELGAEELRVSCNTEAPGLPAPDRKSLVRSGDLEASVDGGVVTISGRGFGHGVGMCQYCAKGFAERGLDYRRMLAQFYPGAWIEKAY